MTLRSPQLRSHLALLLCNIIWACDYPFYNLVLGRYIAPEAMVCGSLIVAALLSLVPMAWEPRERVERSDLLTIAIAALMIGVLRKVLLMEGLSRTSPIDGSIIGTIGPLVVLLVSVAAGIDRLSGRKIVGLLLGGAGAVAVVLTGASTVHVKSQLGGNVMLLGGSCVTALYMVFFKRLVAKYRVTTLLRLIYCFSAVVMLPFGLPSLLRTDFSTMSPHILLAALFVLCVPTYLPNLLLNFSLRYVAPTISSTYAYIQPVLAIALSVAMGLDRLHADTLVAAAIIFVGVGLVISSYGRPSSQPPHSSSQPPQQQ